MRSRCESENAPEGRLPTSRFLLIEKGRPKSKTPAECYLSGRFVLATSYSRTTYRRTTIGAAAFHFRVRNGNGWGHCAVITRSLTNLRPHLGSEGRFSLGGE